jgi:hypothetical protein
MYVYIYFTHYWHWYCAKREFLSFLKFRIRIRTWSFGSGSESAGGAGSESAGGAGSGVSRIRTFGSGSDQKRIRTRRIRFRSDPDPGKSDTCGALLDISPITFHPSVSQFNWKICRRLRYNILHVLSTEIPRWIRINHAARGEQWEALCTMNGCDYTVSLS